MNNDPTVGGDLVLHNYHEGNKFGVYSHTAEYDCLVIGGGISGLTLAHKLHNSNLNILLTESRDYP